ncbi:MAG: peroxidase family protein [Rhizobiaceae bacterium]
MKDTTDPVDHDVAAGMTFFGQFVDHDVTLDATSAIGSVIDPATIRNIRTPSLDLDCVYGDGPEASPHLYHPDHHGFLLFGNAGNPLDLARTRQGTALIGDPRNDENQIVSQLQGAFICLHNIVMTALESGDSMAHKALDGISAASMQTFKDGEEPFQVARRICRLHYQYLVANDLLDAFVDQEVLNNVRHHLEKRKLPEPFTDKSPVMPIEFSGAAYRFGHGTVQSKYQLNHDNLDFDLFELGRKEFSFRTEDKNIAFTKLFDYPGNDGFQKARPIGRKMAKSIFTLPFISGEADIGSTKMTEEQNRKLPLRNLLRDRLTLELPSGQQIARSMGRDELKAPKELTDHGITKTPLWYYCLHEAEKHYGRLGPVGGTIVATVLLRLLYLDPESLVCSTHNFQPWTELGASQDGNYSIGHMLKFVEDNRDKISHAEHLRT